MTLWEAGGPRRANGSGVSAASGTYPYGLSRTLSLRFSSFGRTTPPLLLHLHPLPPLQVMSQRPPLLRPVPPPDVEAFSFLAPPPDAEADSRSHTATG